MDFKETFSDERKVFHDNNLRFYENTLGILLKDYEGNNRRFLRYRGKLKNIFGKEIDDYKIEFLRTFCRDLQRQ